MTDTTVLRSEIDRITDAFLEEFGDLSADELNWKPAPDTWSIAQNVDHLIVLNETYFPILSELRNGTYDPPFLARFGFVASFFGRVVLNAVEPERRRKVKTFSVWEPARSWIDGDVLDRFRTHQERLKEEILASEALLDRDPVIASPANSLIVYRLATAFDIILSHERRHLNQAREILPPLVNDPGASVV